jgi:hypothetical protein
MTAVWIEAITIAVNLLRNIIFYKLLKTI